MCLRCFGRTLRFRARLSGLLRLHCRLANRRQLKLGKTPCPFAPAAQISQEKRNPRQLRGEPPGRCIIGDDDRTQAERVTPMIVPADVASTCGLEPCCLHQINFPGTVITVRICEVLATVLHQSLYLMLGIHDLVLRFAVVAARQYGMKSRMRLKVYEGPHRLDLVEAQRSRQIIAILDKAVCFEFGQALNIRLPLQVLDAGLLCARMQPPMSARTADNTAAQSSLVAQWTDRP